MNTRLKLALPFVLASLTYATPLAAAPFEPPPIEVPDGYVVEMVAAPPLVEHPMMAGFDDEGRLYVADSAGFNMSAEELLAELPNRVLMLEDTDGDGAFDRRTVFADKMTFPMGALWHDGSVYVASPPLIWRLTDTTGDGVADRREELVSRFGFIGNAADIHGCFLSPTGRIFWCDGRHGHEFFDAEGRLTSKGQAARVFSCRPDGSDIEVFCGGGMDNPVEVAFTATGEMLGTMTFYNPDEARHDALVHFIWGGVYPRKHAVTAEFKRTGDFMPPLSLFDVVAPSGLACLKSDHLGPGFRGNALSAHFNTHRIVRHELQRDGATFRSRDSDFVVSSSPDFHPTDVLEDADGSILVIDTGGWFRHGCPTSQVAKPEILGAIYRVRRVDAPTINDPRGLSLDWAAPAADELVRRLDDDRHAVAERAMAALAKRADAVDALERALQEGKGTPRLQRHAVWALCRHASDSARAALRLALDDDDDSVRLAAVHSVGTLRDAGSLPRLIELLGDAEPPIRREAATALGRIGDAAAVPGLLATLAAADDRFLEHALIYALIEIEEASATRAGLSDASPRVRRGALIALDQMDRGELDVETVAAILDTDDVALRQAALDVMASREGWAEHVVARLDEWLDQSTSDAASLATVRGLLTAFAQDEAVEQLIGRRLAASETPDGARLVLLEAIARQPCAQPPDGWVHGLRVSLDCDDDRIRQQAIAAIQAASATGSMIDELDRLAQSIDKPPAERVAAIAALAATDWSPDDGMLALLIEQMDPRVAPLDRLAAASAIGSVRLAAAQRERLIDVVRAAGPLELPALLPVFSDASDEATGRQLIEALNQSPGRANLRPEHVESVLAGWPQSVRDAAADLVHASTAPDEDVRQRLAELEALTAGGDPQRGKNVFGSPRAACAACHRIGDTGGTIGPDLTTIGRIRTPRDLLEAIAYPSLSLARGYESYTITTTDGRIHTGLIHRETADAVYLQTAEQREIALRRDAIEDLSPSNVSIMPQGLIDVLRPDELRDLIAFLVSLN